MSVQKICDKERFKMLRAHSIGPKMVTLLEQAGIQTLAEMRGKDAHTVLLRIEVETGVKLSSMGLNAVRNLIVLAEERVSS